MKTTLFSLLYNTQEHNNKYFWIVWECFHRLTNANVICTLSSTLTPKCTLIQVYISNDISQGIYAFTLHPTTFSGMRDTLSSPLDVLLDQNMFFTCLSYFYYVSISRYFTLSIVYHKMVCSSSVLIKKSITVIICTVWDCESYLDVKKKMCL